MAQEERSPTSEPWPMSTDVGFRFRNKFILLVLVSCANGPFVRDYPPFVLSIPVESDTVVVAGLSRTQTGEARARPRYDRKPASRWDTKPHIPLGEDWVGYT